MQTNHRKIGLVSIAITLIATACLTQVVKQDPKDSGEAVNPVAHSPSPTSSQSTGIVQSFEIVAVKGYATPDESKRILKAASLLKSIVASKEFYEIMSKRALVQTNGRTAPEVAAHLQSLQGRVEVKIYYKKFTSAVAYRSPPELVVNLNRKFFGQSTPICDWVSVLGHEALGHALGGYDHDFKYTDRRPFSVPYSINAAIDSLCQEPLSAR